MPELPEAEVVARQLRGRVLGATLKDSSDRPSRYRTSRAGDP